MEVALFFLGAPLALVLIIALLPPGGMALTGIVLAALSVLVAALSIGDDGTGFGHLFSLLMIGAVGLGGLIQLMRYRARGLSAWPVAALVTAVVLAATVPLLRLMGVIA